MSLETKHFYEFKNFRLDPGERVLLRDGRPLPLTPKAFHLLKILVENHGHIVDKDRLITEIWADSFVEEGNLAVNAAMLRKALADDANNPTYIETVPRRGYRFIAEVKEGFAADGNLQAKPAGRANGTYYAFAGLLAVIAALATTAWLVKDRIYGVETAPILSAPFNSTRFSTSGTVSHAVISPDGKYAAFVDASGGSQSLWLRQIDSGENIQIVPPSGDVYFGLAFANSGNSIFFVRKATDSHGLPSVFRVAAFGGIPVKLIEGAQNWISLSPDDKQISFIRCSYKKDNYCSLFIADVDGTNERNILSKPSPILVESNQFSPDGRSIAVAYGEFMTGAADNRIALIDLESGAERNLLPRTFFDIKSIRWLPSGDALLFTVRDYEDGQISIWKAAVAGGEPENLTKDAATYQDLSLDGKGERMIATRVENDFQIYLGDGTHFKPLTSARDVSVGPEGKIVYSTFDGDIWTISGTGAGRRQLTTGPWGDLFPRFSRDGRYIFFNSRRLGDNNVWRMNSDGSGPLQVTQKTGGGACGVTPDGKWLYFTRLRKLYKVPTDGGDEIPVSDVRVLRAACSPDGNLAAYFFMENGFKIGVLNTTDGRIEKVLNYGDAKTLPQRIAWSPDSRTLNFIINSGGTHTLWQQSLTEAAPRMIANLEGDEIRDLAIMPDGKSFAFVRGKWINDAVLITGLK